MADEEKRKQMKRFLRWDCRITFRQVGALQPRLDTNNGSLDGPSQNLIPFTACDFVLVLFVSDVPF